MSNASSTTDTIEHQAGEWLVRRSEGSLPAAEERLFRQWLAADQRHGRVFRSLERTWGDMAALTHLGDLAPLAQAPARRRTFVSWGAAAAVALIAIGGWFALQLRGESFHTDTSEMRTFVLADGSEITLGARSTLQVVFRSDRRSVILSEGEGFFRVAPDASRPFTVQAGDAVVRAVGTEFDVRHGGEAVRVSVLEGTVDVGAGSGDAAPSRLTVGQRAQIAAGAVRVLSLPSPAPVSPDVAAWRFGRLVYDDAPLAQLVADANRYYAPGVQLAGAGLADLHITAAFRTGDTAETVMALARALSLPAVRRADGRIVLSAPAD